MASPAAPVRAAGSHQAERLLERSGQLRGFEHGNRHLGDGRGDRSDVDCLEVLFVQLGDRCLPGDAQHGNRVGERRVQAGDHVGAGRTRRPDAHADVAVGGAAVAVGHMGGALDVAGEGVANAAVGAHRRVQRVDGGAGQSERFGGALLLEDQNGGVDGTHQWHGGVLLLSSDYRPRPESCSTRVNRPE